MSFKIIGTGYMLPEFRLTNNMLAEMVETSDEWITTRTGIRERRICTTETLEDLAAGAAQKAINSAGGSTDAIDLVICSTIQGDYQTPMLSACVMRRLGIAGPAFDLNAACTGFLYALDVAASYFEAGRARRILVIAAEMMSKHIDWTDRATCVLFGDGAGAVLLERGDSLKAITIDAKPDRRGLLTVGGSAGDSPFSRLEPPTPHLVMNGGEVFKFAVQAFCRDVKKVLKESGRNVRDVTKLLSHQANERIIRSAAERMGFAEHQLAINIGRCGNTSSASIPILLGELAESGAIRRGDKLVCAAFGGGMTSGACLIEY